MAGKIEARLQELGITLPTPNAPVANYVPYVITGKLVFISGQVPLVEGKPQYVGKVGATIDLAQAQAAARLCALNLLAHLKNACGGDLDRVRRAVRVCGFVNAVPEFTDHPKVVNGASDLLVEVLGEAGKHARAAVGSGSLPLGVSVEVEGQFEIE